MAVIVGQGSHTVTFSHPEVGDLHVRTGMDNISWGYQLNTANFPTYGGEVVQILSCYVDDLTVQGTLQSYLDMEKLYSYFLDYLQVANTTDRNSLEHPMVFQYPHRQWEFEIVVTSLPGYRKGREVVAPTWQLQAHVVDNGNDIDELKQLIVDEAQIKAQIGSDDPHFDEHFGLQGKIRFIDENPFSDPFTDQGLNFANNRQEALQHIGDYYSTLLPSYLNGDFDAIFSNIGSQPSFSPNVGPKGNLDTDTQHQAIKQASG
jgi:hypothetical protein